jgi:hypothetical protein
MDILAFNMFDAFDQILLTMSHRSSLHNINRFLGFAEHRPAWPLFEIMVRGRHLRAMMGHEYQHFMGIEYEYI